MALIEDDSRVGEPVLREMLKEHLEGIRSFRELLEDPRYTVTDPARVALARSFASHMLTVLESNVASDLASLRARVNLSYETMLIVLDYLKTYTEQPKVPRPKTPVT